MLANSIDVCIFSGAEHTFDVSSVDLSEQTVVQFQHFVLETVENTPQ